MDDINDRYHTGRNDSNREKEVHSLNVIDSFNQNTLLPADHITCSRKQRNSRHQQIPCSVQWLSVFDIAKYSTKQQSRIYLMWPVGINTILAWCRYPILQDGDSFYQSYWKTLFDCWLPATSAESGQLPQVSLGATSTRLICIDVTDYPNINFETACDYDDGNIICHDFHAEGQIR